MIAKLPRLAGYIYRNKYHGDAIHADEKNGFSWKLCTYARI